MDKMITKVFSFDIDADGNKTNVLLGCSADTLRRYRINYGKDLLKELPKMTESGSIDAELIENLAFIMMKQANPNNDQTINEWLEQFTPLALIHASNDIFNFWASGMVTTAKPKKKSNL